MYFCCKTIETGGMFMDSTMELVSFELPKTDLKLFKELAKKMGWIVYKHKSGIEKSLEDVKAGRVFKAKDADDLFKQILG